MSTLERYLGRKVEIIYMDRKGAISQRDIRPLAIAGDKVKAYCYAQQGLRFFRSGHILAWVPQPEEETPGKPEFYPRRKKTRGNPRLYG
ncbi:hypothetical protein ACFVVQ_17525 [Paenibacillus chitinolyticus]|uniref:hypothetical protein n=1 Tax=Paenibacillus chitinolyticus TaxID=79263 RepID=UPI0036DEAF3C